VLRQPPTPSGGRRHPKNIAPPLRSHSPSGFGRFAFSVHDCVLSRCGAKRRSGLWRRASVRAGRVLGGDGRHVRASRRQEKTSWAARPGILLAFGFSSIAGATTKRKNAPQLSPEGVPPSPQGEPCEQRGYSVGSARVKRKVCHLPGHMTHRDACPAHAQSVPRGTSCGWIDSQPPPVVWMPHAEGCE